MCTFIDRFLSPIELAVLLCSHRPLPDAVPVAGADRFRRPHLRGRRRLSGGVHALLLRRGPAGLGRRRAGAVRRRRQLAAAVLDLLDSPAKLDAARAEARRVGARPRLAEVGKATLEVLAEAAQLGARQPAVGEGRPDAAVHRRSSPSHLLTLVDDVGIIQHAYGIVPNRSTGYCVDDVARLAIAALGLERELSDARYRRIAGLGAGFPAPRLGPARRSACTTS